jgi:hypothetical protein
MAKFTPSDLSKILLPEGWNSSEERLALEMAIKATTKKVFVGGVGNHISGGSVMDTDITFKQTGQVGVEE